MEENSKIAVKRFVTPHSSNQFKQEEEEEIAEIIIDDGSSTVREVHYFKEDVYLDASDDQDEAFDTLALDSNFELTYCASCQVRNKLITWTKDLRCEVCQSNLEYVCERCDKMYKRIKSLRYHLRHDCNKDPAFNCDYCDYKTTRKASLQLHMKCKHSKVQAQHACPKCGKVYKHRFHMLGHSKYCGKTETEICQFCDYKTYKPSLLKMHIRNLHTDLDKIDYYHCSICRKSYKHSKSYYKHKLTCPNAVIIECAHCDYNADNKLKLLTHIKREHKDIYPSVQQESPNDRRVGTDAFAFTSVTEADLNKLKINSPRKKGLNIINPANRFEYLIVDNLQYAEPINREIILENPNTTTNTEDAKTQEILMANLTNAEVNPDAYIQSPYNQRWTLMDVRTWVELHDKKQLRMSPLTNVLDSGVVEPSDRRELVRIAVSGMVEYNEGNLYPSCQLKTQLAKDIITAFPKLCSANGGYEHFYDPKTNRGFIEFRLKTLRLKLNPSEKKRATSTQTRERKTTKAPTKVIISENLLEDDEFKSKISELFMKMPTAENKMDIFRLTEETRANRQKHIKTAGESMSLAIVFNTYPRFKDYKGELIRREFLAEYPNNDLFLERFSTYYTPRILQYCSSTKPHLLQAIQNISDNNLKALILLPELLPSPNYTKRKENKTNEPKTFIKVKPVKTIPNENLLQFINVSSESALNEISVHRKSPFLLCCTFNQERQGKFYIRTDGHVIDVGDNAIFAFDILLKLHYCFDVPFASDLVYFYDFITGCILQLNEPKGCCVALNTSLSHITLSNADPSNMFMFSQ